MLVNLDGAEERGVPSSWSASLGTVEILAVSVGYRNIVVIVLGVHSIDPVGRCLLCLDFSLCSGLGAISSFGCG
jgi:hypothetical protein